MEQLPSWDEIIEQALINVEEERGFPVVGAAFYHYVQDSAEDAARVFPPDPEQNFKDFLEDHLAAVWVVPRPRKDFWVFPPDGADFLAAAVRPAYIRKDLFTAFTHVSEDNSRWYDYTEDDVVIKPANADVSEPQLHRIPVPSEEEEVDLRREFIASSVDGEAAEKLEDTLDSDRPFSKFSEAVRNHDLQQEWHAFRLERVLQRIRDWCVDHGLRWHPEWIETPKFQPDGNGRSDQKVRDEDWDALMEGFRNLNEDELGRISVPLDLVLKLMRR